MPFDAVECAQPRIGLGMANIERRETTRGVRYDVRYRTATGTVRTRTFKRRKDADAHRSLVEADLLRGEWCDPRLGRVSFADWTKRWKETTVNLRPSTIARDDSYLRSLILPTFADYRILLRSQIADLTGACVSSSVTCPVTTPPVVA